jgi:hypothetical protein
MKQAGGERLIHALTTMVAVGVSMETDPMVIDNFLYEFLEIQCQFQDLSVHRRETGSRQDDVTEQFIALHYYSCFFCQVAEGLAQRGFQSDK